MNNTGERELAEITQKLSARVIMSELHRPVA